MKREQGTSEEQGPDSRPTKESHVARSATLGVGGGGYIGTKSEAEK